MEVTISTHVFFGGWEGSLAKWPCAILSQGCLSQFSPPAHSLKTGCALRSRLTISHLHAWFGSTKRPRRQVERPPLLECVHSHGRGGCQGERVPHTCQAGSEAVVQSCALSYREEDRGVAFRREIPRSLPRAGFEVLSTSHSPKECGTGRAGLYMKCKRL